MGRGVKLRLFVDRQPFDVDRIERMITRQMRPIAHADDIGFGDVDRLQPDAKFVGVEAAQPFARRATMAGAALFAWFVFVEIA